MKDLVLMWQLSASQLLLLAAVAVATGVATVVEMTVSAWAAPANRQSGDAAANRTWRRRMITPVGSHDVACGHRSVL